MPKEPTVGLVLPKHDIGFSTLAARICIIMSLVCLAVCAYRQVLILAKPLHKFTTREVSLSRSGWDKTLTSGMPGKGIQRDPLVNSLIQGRQDDHL